VEVAPAMSTHSLQSLVMLAVALHDSNVAKDLSINHCSSTPSTVGCFNPIHSSDDRVKREATSTSSCHLMPGVGLPVRTTARVPVSPNGTRSRRVEEGNDESATLIPGGVPSRVTVTVPYWQIPVTVSVVVKLTVYVCVRRTS